MKTMRKALALLMALAIVMSLGITAFATATTHSITLKNDSTQTNVTIKDKTFTAYKVFNLSTDADNKKFTYTVAPGFEDFFFPENVTDNKGDKLIKYVTDSQNLSDLAKRQDLANAAVKYVNKQNPYTSADTSSVVKYVGTVNAATANSETVTFSNMEKGYYVIVGEAADGTAPIVMAHTLKNNFNNPEITLKASAPTVEKTTEDKNASANKNGTSAQIGDEVPFTLTTATPDTANYVHYQFGYKDTLSKGLSYIKDAAQITATVNGTALIVQVGNTTVPDANCFVTFGKSGVNETMTISLGSELDGIYDAKALLETGTKSNIVVKYKAKVLDSVTTTVVENNDVYPVFSNDPNNWIQASDDKVPHDQVYVYDFDLGVVKTEKGSDATKLAGAKFVLSKENTPNGNYYSYADKKVSWVAKSTLEAAVEDTTVQKSTTVAGTGKLDRSFQGLEAGTYYLHEVEAPAGYNKLENPIKIDIVPTYGDDGKVTKVAYKYSLTDSNVEITETTQEINLIEVPSGSTISFNIPVANASGNALPETGGIGTTIFYTVGAILMISAVALFITKKKMAQ